ncbi:MAG TPA: hypothetical protein VHM22_06950, partial [Bradyrhizobium sp.]|nr:hypothetical protein [Bradyrhizobium sp.]
MAKWTRKDIQNRAQVELEQSGEAGIRYMELAKRIHALSPDTPFNSVVGALHDLSLKNPEIVRPIRGLWVLKQFWAKEAKESIADSSKAPLSNQSVVKSKSASEDDFYELFADWLVGQDQVIESMVVGGSTFKNKWATPDVIGTYKPRKSDPVTFPIELVSAEIKIDPSQSIVAFGQACAYRLFSHKTFIVMPSTINESDLDRLEALCSLYGMGLVIFEINPDAPNFSIKLKPQRLEPDMFYVNDFARRLLEANRHEFDRLFG